MTPEELRKLIDDLKTKNGEDLNKIESLIEQRDSYSLDSEDAETRNLIQEEIDKLNSDIDALMKAVENRNKEIERNDKLLFIKTNASMNKRNVKDKLDNPDSDKNEGEIRKIVQHWLKTGEDKEVREVLQAGVSEGGGYTIAPQYLVKGVLKELDSSVHIRKHAFHLPAMTGYHSIGIPTLDSDLNNLDWTAEIGEVPEDKSITFGRREMKANQLTKLVLISRRLIRESNIDIEGLVQSRIAYKLASTLEYNYLYGNGNSKPLGIFAQTSDNSAALPSDRDLAVGTSKDPISYDGLVDAVGGLKSGYHHGAVWMLNRKSITALRKMKDTNNRPIWQDGIQGTAPSMLLGIPVVQNDFIEDKLESGKYIGFLANLKHYWLLDSVTMELRVLHELYSRTNQVGYQVGFWGDGAPVMSEAYVRLTAYDKPYTPTADAGA